MHQMRFAQERQRKSLKWKEMTTKQDSDFITPQKLQPSPASKRSSSPNQKGKAVCMSVPEVTMFNPRGMVSPGGRYRRQQRARANKKPTLTVSSRRTSNSDRDWLCDVSDHQHKRPRTGNSPRHRCDVAPEEGVSQGSGRSFWNIIDQVEAIRVTKNRAKQAMKLFFHIQKNGHRRKGLRSTPPKKKSKKPQEAQPRPPTPHHTKQRSGLSRRGWKGMQQFQYESLSESFIKGTDALEKQLLGGVRIQMKAVPRDDLFDERLVFYDNYMAKLFVKESKYVFELWKPMTGEVISNFFERIKDIFLVDKIGLIYVTIEEANPCKGVMGGGDSDVAIRYGDERQTRQLCMLLSLCHLKNIGVQPVGSEEEAVDDEEEQWEALEAKAAQKQPQSHSLSHIVSTTGVAVTVHRSRSGSGCSSKVEGAAWGSCRVAYGVYAVFSMLLLVSLMGISTTNFEVGSFLFLL